jgi:hypothetical protein
LSLQLSCNLICLLYLINYPRMCNNL